MRKLGRSCLDLCLWCVALKGDAPELWAIVGDLCSVCKSPYFNCLRFRQAEFHAHLRKDRILQFKSERLDRLIVVFHIINTTIIDDCMRTILGSDNKTEQEAENTKFRRIPFFSFDLNLSIETMILCLPHPTSPPFDY